MSKIYGLGVGVRNLMFNWHILKSRKFDIPVIVVGNLTVGGSGKTPMTEYIINLLKYNYHVGVVSRGYMRSTKGFVLATSRSTPLDIGDEPYQIYQKFGREVSVAVCENRCLGIDELRKIDPAINVIVLDDAFQHRYVKADISVLLTEFTNPVFNDHLLPLGRLREPMKSIYNADFIVVTKCPEKLSPIEYRLLSDNLKLCAYQKLFFSRVEYLPLKPVFPEVMTEMPNLSWLTTNDSILALSGIANPRAFVKHIKRYEAKVRVKVFPDHHYFTRKDIEEIVSRYEGMNGDNKLIITTEKDAVRLANNPYFPHALKKSTFYLPIRVEFDPHTRANFDIELTKMLKDRSIKI